jgi:pyridoxamine 5'-phosphate oxidase
LPSVSEPFHTALAVLFGIVSLLARKCVAEASRRMPGVDDPLTLFQSWLEGARAEMGYDADAMVVATATPDGAPSARVVLLKGVDDRGLVFFTNYSSRKGSELERNPRAALLFYWHPLGRQVRVEGAVSRVDRAESEAYAHSRPRQSQLSALASPQSEVVPDRAWLERRVEELAREHPEGDLPLREDWGGFRVTPDTWEFWENRDNRLHDRHRYSRADDGWRIERLAP